MIDESDMPPDWQEAAPAILPAIANRENGEPPADLKRTKRVTQPAPVVDRLPPYAEDAERGVLGCILISVTEAMPEAIEMLRENGQEFYDLRHTTIYEEMLLMYDEGVSIDVITLSNRLKDKKQLENIGGVVYLSELSNAAPSASNVSYYLAIISEKYVLRKMIQFGTELAVRGYDYNGKVETLLDEVERDFSAIGARRIEETTPDVRTLINGNITAIEEYSKRDGIVTGVSTGFADLDVMTSGLQPSEMIVIAARPSMGKTSLAMNMADSICVNQKLPIGVFSLEMAASALTMRMLCSRARVNARNVRDGYLSDRDFPKLTAAAGKLANAPLFIDDAGSLTITQLRAKARRMVERRGVKVIIIDYLQLLKSGAKRYEGRQQEVAEIARGIKALAKELVIPIVVLCQLNRDVEREKGRAPRMSDLRESGEIENAADVIAFLYKVETEDGREYEEAIPVNLLIGKSRNGPTGDVNLTFLKQYTRFENAAKVYSDDVPTQGEMSI